MCRKWQILRYLAKMSVCQVFLSDGGKLGAHDTSRGREPLFSEMDGRFVIFRLTGISAWIEFTFNILNMIDLEKVQLQKLALEKEFDFKFETTFWEEFSIADQYGSEGVVEHYNQVFEQWKDNLRYLSELVLVLNWKIYQWYQVDDDLGLTYDQLWKRTDGYAMETLKGDDLHYYLSTLD